MPKSRFMIEQLIAHPRLSVSSRGEWIVSRYFFSVLPCMNAVDKMPITNWGLKFTPCTKDH